jgi:hypothetical protein
VTDEHAAELVALRTDVEDIKNVCVELQVQTMRMLAHIEEQGRMLETMNAIEARNPMGGKVHLLSV